MKRGNSHVLGVLSRQRAEDVEVYTSHLDTHLCTFSPVLMCLTVYVIKTISLY